MASPSLMDFILQPELFRQLVQFLPFRQSHQLLGLNKKLETYCKGLRRTMQGVFRSVLDAKPSYLFQQTLIRLMPVSRIRLFMNPVEAHQYFGISSYVYRKNVHERRALRLLTYVRQRRISHVQYGRALQSLRCVLLQRIAWQSRKHFACRSNLARHPTACLIMCGREGYRIEGCPARAFIGTWASS